MEFVSRLMTLAISNSLPVNELAVANDLLRDNNLLPFLRDAVRTKVITVVSAEVPSVFVGRIMSHERLSVSLFPVSVLSIFSMKPSKVAEYVSSTVCSLMKKIFLNSSVPFKGVVAICMGVDLNQRGQPGCLLWKLRECDFISLDVQSIDVVTAVSFTDSFTMSNTVEFFSCGLEIPRRFLSPNEALTLAMSVFTDSRDNLEIINGITTGVVETIPLAFLREG